MSDNWIDRLAIDLKPTSRSVVARRLGFGVAAGTLVSVLLAGALLGFRPDMVQAMCGPMFWVKLAYVAAWAGLALWACERLARPAAAADKRIPWLLAPVLTLMALAAWQLAHAPAPMRMHMLMGNSANLCPWLIVIASFPPLTGLFWAVRGLAPTRLRLTGTLMGLAAGGAGACAYALHCDEAAAPFLAIWYTLGICGAGLIGALTGPRLLRW